MRQITMGATEVCGLNLLKAWVPQFPKHPANKSPASFYVSILISTTFYSSLFDLAIQIILWRIFCRKTLNCKTYHLERKKFAQEKQVLTGNQAINHSFLVSFFWVKNVDALTGQKNTQVVTLLTIVVITPSYQFFKMQYNESYTKL